MEKKPWFAASLAAMVLFFSLQIAAQEPSGTGWQTLFNGQDLSGWKMLNGQHHAVVEDGVIVGTTVAGEPNGFLCTTEDYGDFVLELEVKADLLLDNSGIQFRSNSYEEYRNGRLHGYQAQIENRPPHYSEWNGAITEEAGRGWVYILEDDPIRQKAYVQNQWNHYRIEAIGTTNRVWINGVATAHFVDDKSVNGCICLQFHGGALAEERGAQSVYMRNVRIKTKDLQPLPYDDIPVVNMIPNNLSPQEKHQGFNLLFDGKTAANWQGIGQANLPETGWKIAEGAITISPSKVMEFEGIAMTAKQYGSFELKFEFKVHGDETIVGVEYLFDGQAPAVREAIYGQLVSYNANHRAKMNPNIWKEWNHGVIKVLPDKRVQYWLNGYKILEYKRDDNQPEVGHILFDARGKNAVSYRSVKIRELN